MFWTGFDAHEVFIRPSVLIPRICIIKSIHRTLVTTHWILGRNVTCGAVGEWMWGLMSCICVYEGVAGTAGAHLTMHSF